MIIAEYRIVRQYGKCLKWINVTRIDAYTAMWAKLPQPLFIFYNG